MDTAAKSPLRSLELSEHVAEMAKELAQILGAPVREQALGEGPDLLIGIQLRRVGR